MGKSKPSSVTAEEAVARMINMDYIPAKFTLEEMLSAFSEEAEVEYDNAKIDKLPESQIESLRVRFLACTARETTAHLLLHDLLFDAHNNQDSEIVISQEGTSKPRYTLDSVAYWAAFKYGIGIPEWATENTPSVNDVTEDSAAWEDIEIRIRSNNKIAYSQQKGIWEEKTFTDIGLIDKKTQKPNHTAGILIGLSNRKKFPPSGTIENSHKTAISRLRGSLKSLTGIESDPFQRFNKTDGWRPRFKLTDDRRNADERAKKAAQYEEYDPERAYEPLNDEAGKWIEDNE